MKLSLIVATLACLAGASFAQSASQDQSKQSSSQSQDQSSKPSNGKQDRQAGQSPVLGETVAVAETDAVVKVDKVDAKNNTVTFKDKKGDAVNVHVPTDVKPLEDVKPGSTLHIRYLQSAALAVAKPGIAPSAGEEQVTLVPKNPKRNEGETVVDVHQMTGTVQDIDRSKRTLAIKGPDGSKQTLQVPPGTEGFDQAKVGDTVVLRVTDAVAVSAVSTRHASGHMPGR